MLLLSSGGYNCPGSMADIASMNGVGRNSLATKNRRKVFLSTYCVNSNESSIESPHGTPPMRRHSDVLRGSKISAKSQDQPEEKTGNERLDIVQRRLSLRAPQIRGPLIRSSKGEPAVETAQKNLLMKTCSVLLKDSPTMEKYQKKKKRKNKCTYSINNNSPKKNAKSLHRKGLSNLTHKKTPKPPLIIIEDLDQAEDDKTEVKKGLDTLANLLRRDSLKTIALKAKEKQAGKNKTKSKDMSHIKAKWLLGLSLTLVSSIIFKNIF